MHQVIQVPNYTYESWKTILLNSHSFSLQNIEGMQSKLKKLVEIYVRKKYSACRITAFTEVGKGDQANIMRELGIKVETGFFIRLRPLPDEGPGILPQYDIWALESFDFIGVVINKQLEYERRNEELPCTGAS